MPKLIGTITLEKVDGGVNLRMKDKEGEDSIELRGNLVEAIASFILSLKRL